MTLKRITDMSESEPLDGSELVEISQLSPTVTISAATISALASDNSYNDSGDGFVAAGFAVGNRVKVSGFTGDTANNILVGTITILTAGKMTIGGTDGDVIVDDAEGESVTISKWESKRATTADVAASAGAGDMLSTNNLSDVASPSAAGANIRPVESLIIACSDETTALTTGTAKTTFRLPYAFTVTAVFASLTTAQTSGSIFTVDINEAGTTILSTKLTIDNTEDDSDTAVTPAVISDASLAHRAKMTVDIDQVGDGTAKGLKIILVGYRT